jgi:exodeoxyribonuclease VII large subunit
MQGDDTEASIISALDKIYQYVDFFDAVVIIRGGGSRSDLSCFDNYWLCCNVAQFPLPILTGIGHDRDESIVDLVAHTQLKTPTAVAEFLITGLADFFETITDLESHFFNALKEKMTTDKNKINQLSQRFPPIIRNIVEKKSHELQVYQIQLKNSVSLKLTESEVFLKKAIRTLNYDVKTMVLSQQQRLNFCGLFLSNSVDNILKLQTGKLQYFENTVQILHPKNTLKRGYSITTKNGKIIKSLTELNTGERIETEFFDGKINSKVL